MAGDTCIGIRFALIASFCNAPASASRMLKKLASPLV
jgi:hypothetical protein